MKNQTGLVSFAMKLVFEAMKKEDLPEVLQLLQQLWPDLNPKLHQLLVQFLNDGTHHLMIGKSNGRTCTFFCYNIKHELWSEFPILYLDALVVDDDIRSNGVGKEVISYLETRALQSSCAYISLSSGTTRENAHKFYKRERFTIEDYGFYRKVTK